MENTDDRPFDIAFYVRAPVFSVQEGVALARALCTRCPKGVTLLVKRARDRLEKAADAAQTALSDRRRQDNQISEQDGKLLDQQMDGLWGGMRSVLDGIACLPHDACPRGKRASTLRDRLFGSTGLAFLSETYAAQYTSMMALLQQIKEDKLDKEIDTLCGPDFLQQIQILLPRYERMVEAMLSRSSEPVANLLSHRNALSRAMVSYTTALCGTVDDEDADSVQRVRSALAPLEGQRTAAAERRSPGPSEPAPAPRPGPSSPQPA